MAVESRNDSRIRKVGTHERKFNNVPYVSPRIVLTKGFNDFIGEEFEPYRACIRIELAWSKKVVEGESIIIFFPRKEKR